MSHENKQDELNQIADNISACTKCELHKTRTNTVPGHGSCDAKVLFIGEAPGEQEDKEGIPFCGRAGKFLDEMIESIGYKREDVFICNTLKCRPPENRDPKDKEKEVCKPYLLKQVSVIEPRLIVTLGRHSTETYLPGTGGISKLHGKPVRRPNGQVYLPLYHPAAALHNGGLRQTLLDDFARIPGILKKIDETTRSNTDDIEKESADQARHQSQTPDKAGKQTKLL